MSRLIKKETIPGESLSPETLLAAAEMGKEEEAPQTDTQAAYAEFLKVVTEKTRHELDAINKAKAEERQFRESHAREAEKDRQKKLEKQAGCSHQKDNANRTSALAGQWDSKHVFHLLCQYCGKEWEGLETVPQYLYVGILDRIGGPTGA